MKAAETKPYCEECSGAAEYCDSVPDGEGGYRLQPLCWLHGADRKRVATSRVQELIVRDGVGHVDRGRCSGDVVCLDCGLAYYDHPTFRPEPCLVLLCDGSVAKL